MSTVAAKSKASANPKVSAKEAARSAADYLCDLVLIRGKPIVEEVQFERGKWLITLGFFPGDLGDVPGILPLPPVNKEYKLFAVDAQTGQVTSMRMRYVPH
jgi:hypothetical protein